MSGQGRIPECMPGPVYSQQGVPISPVHAKREGAVFLDRQSAVWVSPPTPTRLHPTAPSTVAAALPETKQGRSVAPAVLVPVHTEHAGMRSVDGPSRVCGVCQGCGAPLIHEGIGRPRAWCDACRTPAGHGRVLTFRAETACAHCGAIFVPGRVDQLYCTKAHKENASHNRRRLHVSGQPIESQCRACRRRFVQLRKTGRNRAYCEACRHGGRPSWPGRLRTWLAGFPIPRRTYGSHR